ncbi:MAG: deoxyribose-phosphate aldolase [Arenicellales bacterium]|nr:deoxyribose-phosphate aldolase [Arenicellales bacterium]
MGARDVAQRVIQLLDLTNLSDDADETAIDRLCQRAMQAHVAAVCIWPRFVTRCTRFLDHSGISIATVVNFPHGGGDIADVLEQTRRVVADGADEVDLVMPYVSWLRGDRALARDMIAGTKNICDGNALLKVILETGRLRTHERIVEASRDAIAAGADFLKTSTGKIRVSATPHAAKIMLMTIHDADRQVGFKAAGGIRTVRQASNYLRLADSIMGSAWVRPENFRFGASGLLDACQQAVEKE